MKLRRHPLFEAPGGGPGGGAPAPPADVPDAPNGMFTLTYVKALRDEAAGSRVKAREANAALAAVGDALGLAPEHVADPARVRHVATSLRTTAAVEEAMARHGVDRKLTRALLDAERSLAPLADVAPAEYGTHLDEIIANLVRDNPALRAVQVPGAARSGLPIAGPGNTRPTITREDLKHLPKERVAELHKAGLLDHILAGG